MPESVNTTLSAYLDYGADNAFGIGQTEYYLPVITDEDFNNNYEDYGFFNGIGYIRAEQVDDKAASIAVYSSGSYSSSASNLRRVWSSTIETGKTSNDFYLNTITGGQRLRVTLDEVTIPKTKARLVVNGQSFDVYQNGKFYNNKCTLTKLVSNGGGSGTA